MDLAGLCRHTAEDTAPLLAQAGIQLRYQPSTEGLLIPGDAALLSRMLLGLLSNAAKAAPSGTVLLTLRRWGDRAVLTCTNSGSTPDDGQLSALLEGASPHLLPEPGEGAGMGLPIIRHIVALHGGTLLLERREPGGLAATVSLPTGPLSMDLTLSTPAPGAERRPISPAGGAVRRPPLLSVPAGGHRIALPASHKIRKPPARPVVFLMQQTARQPLAAGPGPFCSQYGAAPAQEKIPEGPAVILVVLLRLLLLLGGSIGDCLPGLLVQGKGQLQLLSVTEHRQRHGIPRLMGGPWQPPSPGK